MGGQILSRTEQLRRFYAERVVEELDAAKVEITAAAAAEESETPRITPAEADGLVVVPLGPLLVKLEQLFAFDHPGIPERQDQAAEVVTPARITVDARCPACGEVSTGAVFVTTSLVVEPTGKRELKLKGKTEAIAHSCGQRHVRDVTPADVVDGQLSIDTLREARCVGYTGDDEEVCGHFVSEHVAEGDGVFAADGSEVRACKVAGCGCDDLRLADVADLVDEPAEEAIETAEPTGDDVAAAEDAPAEQIDACPWAGCTRGRGHGGRHSKGSGQA